MIDYERETEKKKGIARLFEIAGERKGLLILAAVSCRQEALRACWFPYWSVYRVLQELLLHASDLRKNR